MPFVSVCCLSYRNIILINMTEKSGRSHINAVEPRDVCSLVFISSLNTFAALQKSIPNQFNVHRRSASCDAATGQQSIT